MFRLFALTIALILTPFAGTFAVTSAKDFGTLPQIYDAALAPNGDEIAILAHTEGRYIIRVMQLSNPAGTSRSIALAAEMKPKYLKWVNNKRLVLSFWQSEEIDHTPIRTGYLFSLNTETMKGMILVDPLKAGSAIEFKFRQFNNVVVDWLEDDPKHILMAYGEDNSRQPDLYRVNVKTGREKIVKRGMNNVQTWYTDRTGEPRIGQGRSQQDGSWVLRIRDANSKKWRFSKDFAGLDANTDIHGFTSNPNQIIVSAYQGKDTIGLYIYDLIEKKITDQLYHNDSYDATGVVLNTDGDKVIGAVYVSESRQVELLGEYDTVLSRMRALFANSTVTYVDQSEDGKKILFEVSNATDPGNLLLVEGKGDPINLGRLQPQINSEDLGAVISIDYTARDGQIIPSFLTIPPSITDVAQLQKIPFIVLPHGGPYARTSKRFDYFAQFFASQGYGVLQMNFRGSAGYGKKFKESGRENWVVMQEDVEDGTRWLISEGLADPKRICIAGWSYGGYAALMGAAKNAELYSCAVSVAGLTDISDFIRDGKKYRFGNIDVKNFFGSGFKDKANVKANSPVKLASQIEIPIFLAHGKRDQIVHFDQFTRLKSALRKAPAKATYMSFKDGDHSLSLQKDRQDLLSGLEIFLTQVNGKSEFIKTGR